MSEIKDYFLIFISSALGVIGGINLLLDTAIKIVKLKDTIKGKDENKK